MKRIRKYDILNIIKLRKRIKENEKPKNKQYPLREGGGKLLVKSISYTLVVCLLFTNSVLPAPRKSATSKRSAKNTVSKRSAVSSTRKTSSKRIASRTPTKISTPTTTTPTTNKSCPICPTCNTQNLEKQISYYMEEFSKKNKEIDELKSNITTLESSLKKEEASEQLSNEDEATRLAKLRIEKVPGTTDDYKCIEGWINHWNINLQHSDSLENTIFMDKYGVIKDETERNKWGKFKKGCPIINIVSENNFPNTHLWILFLYKYDYKSNVYIYTGKSFKTELAPVLYKEGSLPSYKFYTNKLRNTGEYNTEEINNWNGFYPVLETVVFIDDDVILNQLSSLIGNDKEEKFIDIPGYVLSADHVFFNKKEQTPSQLTYTIEYIYKHLKEQDRSFNDINHFFKKYDPESSIYKRNNSYRDFLNPILFPFWNYSPD